MITEQEFKDAQAAEKAAQNTINAYCKQKSQNFEARWKRFNEQGEVFTDADLNYAAGARCHCGHGLAHPKNCGVWHQWTCAAVLKGIGTDKGHEAYPFSFYEIKSEEQPSANGNTTRPKPGEDQAKFSRPVKESVA